ncbi:MAG: APC family permease [Parabacteroides sp.]|nr:APC family permease [Parabacteroides sp.]
MSRDTVNVGLREHKIKLSTAVFIMYCLVAAGAFGIEEMISASGPGLTILMLILLPFLWAAPQALVSAELGSAIPEAGGFYKWVQRGLGEFWAFQAGWCRTLSCYLDNTIYVVLAASYLGMLVPMSSTANYIVKASIILVFTCINLRGIKDVGMVSSILSMIVLIAFAAVAVVGFANWNQNPFVPFMVPDESLIVNVGASLAIGMWMYSGYTAMSNLSAEIEDKSVIPKGLLIILPLSALSYILPTIGGLASVGQWENWSTSGGISFGTVLGYLGSWGTAAFLIVAILANMSIFNTYIISISRGFYAMAEDNLAPKSLVKCSKKHGVPYVGVISLGVFCLLACTFDFTVIVTIDVMLLMVDYILVWIAGVNLRRIEPDMPRPFKIPVGTKGVIAIVSPGIAIATISLLLNGTDYFFAGMIGLISSPVMYYIWKRMYGGMTKVDPQKYPMNPKTKLGFGDLDRMAAIFAIIAILGFIGCFFFPWYEGSWGAEYYMEEYGSANAFEFLLNGVKWMSVLYVTIFVVLKLIARKVDPKQI